MSRRLLQTVLFLLLLAFTPAGFSEAPSSVDYPPERYSNWMSEPDLGQFGKWFDKAGFWPVRVEGRLKDNKEEFRVVFERQPLTGKRWYYWWFNMEEDFYRARHAELAEKGFVETSFQQFTTEKGEVRYQAIWRRIDPP